MCIATRSAEWGWVSGKYLLIAADQGAPDPWKCTLSREVRGLIATRRGSSAH